MIQDFANHLAIALLWHALVFVKEIIVVIVKSQRQTFEDRGRQLRRRQPPLFDRIALEKGLVEITPDKAQRLLFKALRLFDRGLRLGLRDKGARLIWAQGFAKELIDGVQVHRQGKDLAPGGGFHPVFIGPEAGKLVHILPDLGVIGVKDMGPVDMQQHPGVRIAGGMAIAADMIATVHHLDLMARLGQMPPDHRTREPGPHHQELACDHDPTLPALALSAALVSSRGLASWPYRETPAWPRSQRPEIFGSGVFGAGVFGSGA